ncbi:MAG TPA: O-acetyl-ADP-ribose deacetylase [Myxococcota bacterium]|nr:O-acetyl-ADP-ribose deacetylase [Myxococcota bacterium]
MREVLERIELVTADITSLAVDAIVNAANASLAGGGGVDGAIHRAAGPKLLEECLTLGGCPPGEARMTGGYELPARWVIHAVGPIWRGGGEGEATLLASAYTESLRLALRSELGSIAFPALSTGAYGFPLEPATRIAVRAVGTWLVQHEWPRRVTFCCFRDADAAVYRAALDL